MQTVYLNTCIVDPICSLISPLSSTRANVFDKITHLILSEVVSRIIAISTSLFAALDLVVITTSTVVIFTIIVITQIAQTCIGKTSYQKSCQEIHSLAKQFFSQTKRCLSLGFIGSTAGLIEPAIFKDFNLKNLQRAPFTSSFQSHNQRRTRIPPASFTHLPNQPRVRATATEASRELTHKDKASLRRQLMQNSQNLQKIEAIWRSFASPEDDSRKLFFAVFFDQESAFSTIRERFASRVYRSLNPFNPNPQWLSTTETVQRVRQEMVQQKTLPRPFNPLFCEAFYYHATREKSFEQILKNQKINVNARVFKGAFVSTKPETSYGNYIFALRKKIEQKTHLDTGFTPHSDSRVYWAGIDKDIPVTDETLAYVIVDTSSCQSSKSSIEENCFRWTNRRITVISLEKVRPYLQAIAALSLGIPRHWPKNKVTQATT